MPKRMVKERAEVVHLAWMRRLQSEGITSRVAHWGEELMRPWSELSERARAWNIDGVEDHDAAIELFDSHD